MLVPVADLVGDLVLGGARDLELGLFRVRHIGDGVEEDGVWFHFAETLIHPVDFLLCSDL